MKKHFRGILFWQSIRFRYAIVIERIALHIAQCIGHDLRCKRTDNFATVCTRDFNLDCDHSLGHASCDHQGGKESASFFLRCLVLGIHYLDQPMVFYDIDMRESWTLG